MSGEGVKRPPEQVEPTREPKITINILATDPPTPAPHPCAMGRHRPAWLVAGGVACGYCGVRL